MDSTDDQWAAARAKSARVKRANGPTVQTKNEGFFQRSRRKISQTLPAFHNYPRTPQDWREAEKLGRGRWTPGGESGIGKLKTFVGNVLRRFKFVFVVLATVAAFTMLITQTGMKKQYRASKSLGGGSNFVIILAANEGGGVMEWKGPREWAIERDSIRNKKKYADRWGYHLEVADMSTKKRYAHEWRESWEKVDTVRNAMAKYPNAEWFWWLDLTTFIMEPSYSLQSHIFNHLSQTVYRDINHYNPLNITHPPTSPILDPVSSSPSGDNTTASIDLIITQDCSGFNLGSFFTRRSAFTERLFDIWWDPVLYEQKHMEWEHKEQDALEHLYEAQPYLRSHIAFLEQRKVNSFPSGACPVETTEEERELMKKGKLHQFLDERFHYNEADRDFMVNMAGCEWGRDCWQEMYTYRELSNRLNRTWWERLKDGVVEVFGWMTAPRVVELEETDGKEKAPEIKRE